MGCTNFLIWQVDCKDTSSVIINPEIIQQLVNIIYATFPHSIRPVTIEGSHIIEILGGSEICPASFNPQSLVRVDRLTHEFTSDQISLLRTLIENLVVQSARTTNAALNIYLAQHGLTTSSLLSLITQEIERVISPPVINHLLTTTQPQSLTLPGNLDSSELKDKSCKVNQRLPTIIFSAALLEQLTNAILSNNQLKSVLMGIGKFTSSYRDPLDLGSPIVQTREITSNTLFWIILIIGVILLLGVHYYLSWS